MKIRALPEEVWPRGRTLPKKAIQLKRLFAGRKSLTAPYFFYKQESFFYWLSS
jgi:hypothetical protein